MTLASSIELAKGEGDAHAYVIYFEPGGIIGPHEAGSAGSFLPLPAAAGSRAACARRTTPPPSAVAAEFLRSSLASDAVDAWPSEESTLAERGAAPT